MLVTIRDKNRFHMGVGEVELSNLPGSVTLQVAGESREVEKNLQWDNAIDEAGCLCQCPSCGCREIFKRRDFPQVLGLSLVIVSAMLSVGLFAFNYVSSSIAVLLTAVIADLLIYRFTGMCVVCYRCRSEFRELELAESLEPWDLAIGEKYRPARMNEATNSNDSTPAND